MKICRKCASTKDISNFGVDNSKKDNISIYCKECIRKKRIDSWLKYPIHKKRQHKEEKKRRLYRAKQWVMNYLSTHSCVDCGESNMFRLDFYHVRGKKTNTICVLTRKGSIAAIIAEISKCEVRCANYHRIRHATEINFDRNKFQKSK